MHMPSKRENATNGIPSLDRAFFAREATTVARELIGTILVRRVRGKEFRARLVEVEAYLGPHDLAAHSSKGRTARTEVMFGPAGHAYVYLIYGMHEMFNIVTGGVDDAQAVLVRAAEPLDGWDANLSGPGRLARAMQITRALNGEDLTRSGGLYVAPAPPGSPRPRVGRAVRVGVDYAGIWKDELLRFYDARSAAVSRPLPRPSVRVAES
jgi:DNA-3-methyladenine glycosylase